jgi:hypothetical protein
LAPVVEDREVLRRRVDPGSDLLEDERRCVDPEARRAELQPEAHHLSDLFPHRRV